MLKPQKRDAAVDPVRDRAGIKGQRAVVARDGFIKPAERCERIGAAAVDVGGVGRERERAVDAR